jgi:hypothetical protein
LQSHSCRRWRSPVPGSSCRGASGEAEAGPGTRACRAGRPHPLSHPAADGSGCSTAGSDSEDGSKGNGPRTPAVPGRAGQPPTRSGRTATGREYLGHPLPLVTMDTQHAGVRTRTCGRPLAQPPAREASHAGNSSSRPRVEPRGQCETTGSETGDCSCPMPLSRQSPDGRGVPLPGPSHPTASETGLPGADRAHPTRDLDPQQSGGLAIRTPRTVFRNARDDPKGPGAKPARRDHIPETPLCRDGNGGYLGSCRDASHR